MKYQVTIYGTDESGDTQKTRQRLDTLGIAHQYVDIDQTEKKEVEVRPDGKRALPMIEMTSDLGERRLSAPDQDQLEEELHRLGIIEKGEASVSRE